jgi:PAS domain S-box-containing protein
MKLLNDLSWHILLVDDNPLDRADAKAALLMGSTRRYRFSEADSVDTMLTLCAQVATFDCIVLDFALPDGDALDAMRQLPRDANQVLVAPVVIMTGVAPTEKHSQLLRAGAQDYIGKGWLGPESLTRAVENAVDRHAMTGELNRHHGRQRLMSQGVELISSGQDDALLKLFERMAALVDADLQCHCLYAQSSADSGLSRPVSVGLDAEAQAKFLEPGGDEAARCNAAATAMHELGARAFVYHPIWFDGSLVGAMSFASRRREQFSADDIDFMVGMIGQIAASSERLRVNSKLRDIEAFNTSLLDSSVDCVKLLGLDGCIEHLNENGRRLLEIPRVENVLQQRWSEFWPDGMRAKAEAAFDWACRGRASVFEGACPTFVGAIKWWEVSLSPIRDAVTQQVMRVLVISRDATTRQADAKALRDSRAQLLAREIELCTLADNSPDIIARFDCDLRHTFVNAAITPATGMLPQQIIGKTNHELGMPLENCRVWDQALRQVFKTRQLSDIEFSFTGPSGLRHYQSRLVPEFSDKGLVRHVLGVTHDITERKQIEARREELLHAERAARI